jgi:hypothetical protein
MAIPPQRCGTAYEPRKINLGQEVKRSCGLPSFLVKARYLVIDRLIESGVRMTAKQHLGHKSIRRLVGSER